LSTIDALEGPRTKVARAAQHLQVLQDEIDGYLAHFTRGDAYEVIAEIELESRQEIHRLQVLRPFPAMRWGVLVGDVVHNARSALEHVVELATIAHSGHPLDRTEFPVFHEPTKFSARTRKGDPVPGSGLFALRGVSDKARAYIEGLQPYHRGNDHASSTLWLLHALWNMDKHRIVAVVGATARTDRFDFRDFAIAPGATAEVFVQFPFEDGTHVMEIPLVADQTEPRVQMQMSLELHVLFGDGPGKNVEVTTGLSTCVMFAAGVIGEIAPLLKAD